MSKVPDAITEENIEKYISKHMDTQDIYVKKLMTQIVKNNNQSFMIGVEPYLKQKVYEPDCWPKNVYFSRFNSKLGEKFLDNPCDQEGKHTAGNFLGLASALTPVTVQQTLK